MPGASQDQMMPVLQMHPNAEGEMVLSGAAAYKEAKPALLAHVPNAFGILVWGNENAPAYNSGDVIFIHPQSPPVIGRDVVVKKLIADESGEVGVFIGKLVNESDKQFTIMQYGNKSERKFDKSKYTLDHIVGKYNAR